MSNKLKIDPNDDGALCVYAGRWPQDDASIDEIEVEYYLEFLDANGRMRFMNEAWRVLVPGGKLAIRAPHWSCMRAYADPRHVWPPLCETHFCFYNKEWREVNKKTHYPIVCDFDFGYGFAMIPELGLKNEAYREFAVKHYNNAVLDLLITLTKRA